MENSIKSNKLPNLLLLGAQKSASTFFSTWLSKHPEVYIASKENVNFENPEYHHFDIESLKINIQESIYGFGDQTILEI